MLSRNFGVRNCWFILEEINVFSLLFKFLMLKLICHLLYGAAIWILRMPSKVNQGKLVSYLPIYSSQNVFPIESFYWKQDNLRAWLFGLLCLLRGPIFRIAPDLFPYLPAEGHNCS
uniref:Uncharacterized protein n=1 Tax=Micrurus corallinus TaxID=54390 RepID=A0A2D4F0D8_MICCO